ncbi:Major allergen Pru av 1 [Camellia lanceoleosa]|uniref:Major allergen Pru av 1 n=1 Tax=Camellia lanceoleosa TaxID=1840588 RepID=A0ACC0GU22_9ERIC|nr:Major allergen Pru av 1 [Camellia lanceoleosa]
MGVVTFTEDIASPVPAPRLFKALILDVDNLIPKVVPQAIKSIETNQGDGGPGSINQMNFSISYETKLESDPNGGCVHMSIGKYYTKPGVEVKEEDIKAGKEKPPACSRPWKPTYLWANPDAYV